MATSDPKWIWELNWLQHLPALAQAWAGERRITVCPTARLTTRLVAGAEPARYRNCLAGAFEAGIRAISVAVAPQGSGRARHDCAAIPPDRLVVGRERPLPLARAVPPAASANNHLVGELAG